MLGVADMDGLVWNGTAGRGEEWQTRRGEFWRGEATKGMVFSFVFLTLTWRSVLWLR